MRKMTCKEKGVVISIEGRQERVAAIRMIYIYVIVKNKFNQIF